ncbi:MAG TPA: ABC transporter ATP-binding protein [bacterium]|nr:ABC transporter ATP-binding protein [bacterium]
MSDAVIQLRGVSKRFATRRAETLALDDVSFEVQRGDVFGLLGANGAGKTTAMRCILGLTHISGGSLRVLGRERPSRHELFARTAYLPEEPQLFAGATGREHLAYFGRLSAVDGVRLPARIDETLTLVELGDAADRRIGTYSKGMKQRLGIAAAILAEPEIIFLDEPTRGLDPLGRKRVRDLLAKLAAGGATLFINSHLLGEVERLCNRVGILDNGRVRAAGKLADLLGENSLLAVRFALPGEPGPELAGAERADGGLWKTTVPDTAALAALSEKIAAAGGRVVSAQAERIALEDYFIRAIGREEQA